MDKQKPLSAASAKARRPRRSSQTQRLSSGQQIIADALIDAGVIQMTNDVLALEYFERAAETYPRWARAWKYKGDKLAALGRWAESIEACDTAFGIDPTDYGSLITKGQSLIELGHFKKGIACYDAALKIAPHSVTALEAKGLAWHALRRFQKAALCFDRMVEKARYSSIRGWAWNYKAASLRRMGRYQEALTCCDRAIVEWATDAAFWVTRGNCLRDLRRFEAALKCHKHALAIWPEDLVAWRNKALVEEDLGRTQDAIQSYRRYLEIAPPDNAAEIAVTRQRLEQALKKRPRYDVH